MRRWGSITALGVATAILSGAVPAHAHPHVWATMHSTLLFTSKLHLKVWCGGVAVDWTFDKLYSQTAIDGLDVNGDGVHSADELAPLTRVNLSSLKTYGYFIFVRRNGDKQALGDATDATQEFAHERLTLHFTVPLIKLLDPVRDQVGLKVYDPEYFIDFEYSKRDPVTASAGLPERCRIQLTPIPSDVDLEKTRQMLASKGVD